MIQALHILSKLKSKNNSTFNRFLSNLNLSQHNLISCVKLLIFLQKHQFYLQNEQYLLINSIFNSVCGKPFMICNFCYSQMPAGQNLEDKYKRALTFLSQAYKVIQQLQIANQQLRQDIQSVDQAFEMFKKQSIRQYSILREELERIKNQEQVSDSRVIPNYNGQINQQILTLDKQTEAIKQENSCLIKEIQMKNIQISNIEENYKQKQALMLIRLQEAETGRENLRQYISQIQEKGRSQQEQLKDENNKLQQDLKIASKQLQLLLKQKEEINHELRKQFIEISSLRQLLFKILSTQHLTKISRNEELNSIFEEINGYFRLNS